MSMTIHERVHSRRDLDSLRAARDLDGLAAALNAECIPTMVVSRTTLGAILLTSEHTDVLTDLIQRVADGEDMSARAAELLSFEGVEVQVPGFEPPLVDRLQVEAALFYPDGSEK